VIETQTPIMYLHFTLQPGALMVQPVQKKIQRLCMCLKGRFAGEERAGDKQMVLFTSEEVTITNPSDAITMDVLLIAGVPPRQLSATVHS